MGDDLADQVVLKGDLTGDSNLKGAEDCLFLIESERSRVTPDSAPGRAQATRSRATIA